MYRLIKLAQEKTEGIRLKDNLRKIASTNFSREITMPVSGILKDKQDRYYTIAKAALRSPSEKHMEYEDGEVWSYTPIITAPEIRKNSGSVKFYAFDNTWRCLLDFTKESRKYELIIAIKFKSAYAIWFYELMSGQTKPLFVPLEESDGLRERFYLQGKYEKVNDFHRKVIGVAKKELDKSSPYPFVTKEKKAGKKIIGWTFFPAFYEDREDPALQEQTRMVKVTTRLQLENSVYDYLKFSFDLKPDEISKNKKILIEGRNHIPDFMGLLGESKEDTRLAENPEGHVIGAIKGKLKEI